MLIETGFAPLEIADRSGHESVKTTLDTEAGIFTPIPTFTLIRISSWQIGSTSSEGQYRQQKKLLELPDGLCYSLDTERRLLVTDALRELSIDG